MWPLPKLTQESPRGARSKPCLAKENGMLNGCLKKSKNKASKTLLPQALPKLDGVFPCYVTLKRFLFHELSPLPSELKQTFILHSFF